MRPDRLSARHALVLAHRPLSLIQRWTPFVFLASMLFLPHLVGYFLPGINFVGGLMLASALFLGSCFLGLTRYPRQITVANVAVVLLMVAFFIVAHFTVAMFSRATLDSKSISSVGLLMVEGATIPVLVTVLFFDARDDALWFAGRMLRYVFLASAIVGVLGLSPHTDAVGEKPLFPFTEPSFWGFTFPPILIFTSVRSSPIPRLLWLLAFLVLTVLIQNWTMMVCCLLAVAVSLPNWAAVPASIIGTLGLFGIDLSYYAEHLNFDLTTTESQSALVYIQGWQMLRESLYNSHWWGIGFQQMGAQYTAVPATFRINAIWGYDLNLQDGGFLLSKLGSEFGVFGIAFCAVVLVVAVRAFLILRQELRRRSLSNARVLAYSSCLGIITEVMVRGGNYFTGTVMLYIASLTFLSLQDNNAVASLSKWRMWTSRSLRPAETAS